MIIEVFQYYFKKLFLSLIEENYAFVYLRKKNYKKIMLSCKGFTKNYTVYPIKVIPTKVNHNYGFYCITDITIASPL